MPGTPTFDEILAFKLQIDSNMGANNFDRFRIHFPQLGLPSLHNVCKDMQRLSGLTTRLYDCCRNSCVCFSGPHAELDACPYCDSPRYRAGTATPVKQFQHIPLIPQLKALYGGRHMAEAMLYRSKHHDNNTNDAAGTMDDIYDSALYRALRKTPVVVNGCILPYTYFSQPRDALLLVLTDGFQVFKRGKHTSWPLMFVNCNLNPADRFSVHTTLCGGVIPGPKKPKDFDSFLFPMVEEVMKGAVGVPAFDAFGNVGFPLRFYVPYGSGDMPACAGALRGSKCPGGICSCPGCPIHGIRIRGSSNSSHYLPIVRPDGYAPSGYTMNDLPPFRTHTEWVQQARHVENAPTAAERARHSRDCGINSLAITVNMPGVRFPISFPFDLMHLLENTLSNYLLLFSGDFKGLDSGTESYIIAKADWNEIGAITVASNKLIPSAFGRQVPNPADDRSLFTAEGHLVWGTLYAPILLRDRLPRKYYRHFKLFLDILAGCMQFSTTRAERNQLRIDVKKWYTQYEQYV
jgi:hypothetical protein